jgi:hypothetical protein
MNCSTNDALICETLFVLIEKKVFESKKKIIRLDTFRKT